MSPKSAYGSESADGVEGTLAAAERGANCRHVLGMRVDHIEFSAAAKLIAVIRPM